MEFLGKLMKTFRNYFFYLLLMLFCQTAVAEIAAKVIFAKGETYVVHHTGKKVALKKGAALKAGDTIITQTGYLQLRFTDDAIISFYDNTEFKIEDYHFSKKKDDNEKALFHFAKGVFRTIVGSIKQERYKVRTNIASIGTRGTEYLAKLDDGLHVDVFDGTVVLENQAGNFEIASGHSAFMPDVFSIPRFIRLENKINRPLDNKQQPVNQPAIKQENNVPTSTPENNDSLPTNNSPALDHPEAINEAPSLPDNLSHESLEVMGNHSSHNNGAITNNAPPPRHRELDSHQEEVPAPVTNSVTSTNITIENVLNKKIAPEELPPPEPELVPVIQRPPSRDDLPLLPTDQLAPAPTNQLLPRPTGELAPAPTTEPAPTPITQPAPAPITQPMPAPTTEPAPAPITQPAPAPTTEPAPAPITQPAPPPTTESAPAPITQPAPAPTTESAPAPITQPAPAPTTEPAPAPITQPAPA